MVEARVPGIRVLEMSCFGSVNYSVSCSCSYHIAQNAIEGILQWFATTNRQRKFYLRQEDKAEKEIRIDVQKKHIFGAGSCLLSHLDLGVCHLLLHRQSKQFRSSYYLPSFFSQLVCSATNQAIRLLEITPFTCPLIIVPAVISED